MARGPIGMIAASLVLVASIWPDARASDQTVNIPNNSYQPGFVEIASGEQITWTNTSGQSHTVTSDSCDSLSCNGQRKEQDGNNIWEVGTIPAGSSASMRFYAPTTDLTMRYHCRIHPSMSGTIRVRTNGATASPGPTGSPGPTVTPGPTPTPTATTDPVPATPTPSCFVRSEDAIQLGAIYVWLDGIWMESNGRDGLQRNVYFCMGAPIPRDTRVVPPS